MLPYSFDASDRHFYQGNQRFVTGGDFAEYVIDAFDRLWREGAQTPRMLSIRAFSDQSASYPAAMK